MRYGILRGFNVAGATDRDGEHSAPAGHFIPTVLSVALGPRPQVPLFGAAYPTPDGTCIRDYIHVWDVAQAFIRTLGALDQRSRIYNLGTGQGVSNKDVLRVAGCPQDGATPAARKSAEVGRRSSGGQAELARVARRRAAGRRLGGDGAERRGWQAWAGGLARPGRIGARDKPQAGLAGGATILLPPGRQSSTAPLRSAQLHMRRPMLYNLSYDKNFNKRDQVARAGAASNMVAARSDRPTRSS